MKEPRKDDERLSALLEGRLAGPEREELLAHLAASEDDYEVFTGTARVLRALEAEDASKIPAEDVVPSSPRVDREAFAGAGAVLGTPEAEGAQAGEPVAGVLPFPATPRAPRAPSVPLLKAAAAAGIVLVSALAVALAVRGTASSRSSPVQFALAVDPAGAGLPETWADSSLWSGEFRGPGAAGERDAKAVRAGALLAQLAVAVRAGHTADVQALAYRLSESFEEGVGGPSPLRQLRDPGGAPPDSLQALVERATGRLAGDLGSKPLETGAWIGAARLAANRRNEEFFRQGPTDGMLGRAERIGRGSDSARAALERVRAALPDEGPPRWEPLQRDLDALLRALARGRRDQGGDGRGGSAISPPV